MKRDLSPEDFDGLLESHRQRAAERRFADEYQPTPRTRFGGSLLAFALFWLAVFLLINAPAIWRFFTAWTPV